MVASYVSISNRALLACGARAQISSLQEASEEANAINLLFKPTFEQLGRAAHWGALRAQQTLTLLAAAPGTSENQNGTTLPLPPQPWLYSYSYPVTCLQMRFIVPTYSASTASGTTPISAAYVQSNPLIPGSGQIPFAIAYAVDAANNPIQTILCNQSQAQAVFTINQPNPVAWDSSFQQAYVAALAAFLVPALTMNMQLLEMNVRIAESAITQARVRDGDEGTTSVDNVPDWMRARASGTTYGSGYGGYGANSGFVNINWPSWG